MREVTYSSIKTKIQHAMGLDTLLTSEENAILSSVNKWAKDAWEETAWPELSRIEQRAVNGRVGSVEVDSAGSGYTSAPTIAFSSGGATATAIVKDGEVNAILLGESGANYTTAPTVSFSGGGGSGAEATANLTFTVDYEGASPLIGDVFTIYKGDPRKTAYPQEMDFDLTEHGVLVTNKTDSNPVYVHYRFRFKEYTSTSTDIPYIFQQYIVEGAIADWQLSLGQQEKMAFHRQVAQDYLLGELDKLERQQSQQTHTMTLTHVNQQNRIY